MYTAMPIEQIDSSLAWSVFLSSMIIHYHSGQHLLQPSQVSKQNILSTVMTNITAYKITDHTKPLSIFFFS